MGVKAWRHHFVSRPCAGTQQTRDFTGVTRAAGAGMRCPILSPRWSQELDSRHSCDADPSAVPLAVAGLLPDEPLPHYALSVASGTVDRHGAPAVRVSEDEAVAGSHAQYTADRRRWLHASQTPCSKSPRAWT